MLFANIVFMRSLATFVPFLENLQSSHLPQILDSFAKYLMAYIKKEAQHHQKENLQRWFFPLECPSQQWWWWQGDNDDDDCSNIGPHLGRIEINLECCCWSLYWKGCQSSIRRGGGDGELASRHRTKNVSSLSRCREKDGPTTSDVFCLLGHIIRLLAGAFTSVSCINWWFYKILRCFRTLLLRNCLYWHIKTLFEEHSFPTYRIS